MLNQLLALLVAQTGQGNGLSPWLVLLIFFILVVIVSWAMMRNVDEIGGDGASHDHHEEAPAEDVKAEAVAEVKAEPAPEPEPEPEPEAELVPEAETVEPDDLKKIEGIGPKVASLLNENGILTFDQLSVTEVDQINGILDANKLQMMDATSWPKQAKLAAEGKWEELQQLQDELSGGR